MDNFGLIIMAISVATNIIFVKWKLEHKRHYDALLDGIVFIFLITIFSKTVTGLSIATLASSFVSIYLYFSPPKKLFSFKRKNKAPIDWTL